jgi:hypothetical protein
MATASKKKTKLHIKTGSNILEIGPSWGGPAGTEKTSYRIVFHYLPMAPKGLVLLFMNIWFELRSMDLAMEPVVQPTVSVFCWSGIHTFYQLEVWAPVNFYSWSGCTRWHQQSTGNTIVKESDGGNRKTIQNKFFASMRHLIVTPQGKSKDSRIQDFAFVHEYQL